MNDVDLKKFHSANAGMAFAVQSILRALITSHPAPGELLRAMKSEGEETYALLLARQVPDESLDAFRDFWNSVAPYADDGTEHQDSRISG